MPDTSGWQWNEVARKAYDALLNAFGTGGSPSTTMLTVQGQAADGAAVTGNPLRIGGKDGSGNTQDILTDTSGNVNVGGNVASGTADSGNPVKIGGVYNSSTPTLTNGQRGDAQMDANGNYRVLPVVQTFTGADGFSNGNIARFTTVNSQSNTGIFAIAAFDFNGTSWDRRVKPNATSRIPSAANTTNSTLAKNSAGNVNIISAYNASAGVRYLKLYNKATAPTVGTDTPVITIAIPATGVVNLDMGGHYFSTGIGYGMTTGAADNDTGALTAGDVLGLTISYS